MFSRLGLIPPYLLLLLWLAGCAGARGATANDLSGRHWVLVTTEHFRIYSDLNGNYVEKLALELEKDVRVLALAAFGKVHASVGPTDVIIFSKGPHYHRFFDESTGGVAYRVPLLPEGNHTVATVGHLDESMRATLRHELVHDLFARNFGAAPTWMSEGFAEYFSTVEVVDDRILVGKALHDRVLTHEREPFATREDDHILLAIPLRMVPAPSALLAMNSAEFYVRESDSFDEQKDALRRAANYFGAWAFVHFLMDSEDDYSGRFNRFLQEVKTKNVEQAWQEAFAGVKAAALDKDFLSYLSAGKLAVATTPYQDADARQAPKIRALGTGEKHVLLARLSLAASRPATEKEALFSEHIDAALSAQPPPPEAYYLRGVFAASGGKHEAAKSDFESATELAPTDPRFLRASLGHRLSTIGGRERSEVVREFRSEVEKLERLSTSPLELLLVAQFYASTGETDRALILGNQAASRAPIDPIVLSNYATVLEWCGDLDSAVEVQRRALEFVHEDGQLQKRFGDDLKRLEGLKAQQKPRTASQ